jgi:hypothetical protein
MRRVIKPIALELKMPWMRGIYFRHSHPTVTEQPCMADHQAQMGRGDYRMTMHYTHSDLNRGRQIQAQTAVSY